ncbi:uncharacterized protein LOC123868506 [Maniola jurtina]|uniref:uncharacterized protein LOC123868506 n=1 Tax=Maniola jurtina TaxID=191418 RepID=UPI001E68D0D6|nr:uncharacterized protein LOC123868506 [Maniola jurtina]
MAEDEDGVSDKKSPQNSNNAGSSQQNAAKPDLGIAEAKYDVKENGDAGPAEPISSSSKSTGAMRKEENPFSFRHFLKRDLSLPGNSTYENTGARPKVYANTVQHSPTKIDVHNDTRRDKSRSSETQAKEKQNDDTLSNNLVDIPFRPFNVVDNSDSKHNLYTDNSEPFSHRPNLASEPLGMPSLPDFVQDHILVEQAYLNSNGPISVDLDNLPDFTFNTNFNVGSSSSLGRRNKSGYGNNRGYDYEAYMGASTSESGPSGHIPLDLPSGAEAAGPVPLDLPAHLSLDLTESVNPADRRNVSPRNTFPLDLPPNAGAESMRLPDFLPVHPGRTSPEPEHQDEQLQQIISELERTRSELFAERSRRSRAEEEANSAREAASLLRAEAAAARASEAALRARLHDARLADREYAGQLEAATHRVENNLQDTAARATEAETNVSKLRNEIKRLKEELAASQEEVRSLRNVQSNAATDLRHATTVAETSLRELLSGLERLRSLSSALDPT